MTCSCQRLLTVMEQRIENIPKTHRGLRNLVLDLVKELHSANEARKHFDTKVARDALDDLIELVIETSTEISRFYSRSKIGMCRPLNREING